MLNRLILAIEKWIAIRSLPRDASSYIFFDHYVPLGGAHERVSFCKCGDESLLNYEATNPITSATAHTTIRVAPADYAELFDFLRDWVGVKTSVSLIGLGRDSGTLKLFAYDMATNWKCAIHASNVHCIEDLRFLRAEFLERVKQILRGRLDW